MTTTLPPSGDTPAELAEHLASGARLVEAFHLMPGVARAMREAARLLRKPCTCHPDDSPPFPCPRKYALSECRAAAPPAVQATPVALDIDLITPDDRKRYYDFEKYADHLPTCKQPRGDQSCECGYSAVRTNLSDLLDELSAPAQQEGE